MTFLLFKIIICSFSKRSANLEIKAHLEPQQGNTSRASYPDTPFGDYVQAVTYQTDSLHHEPRSYRLPAPHSAQTYHTSH